LSKQIQEKLHCLLNKRVAEKIYKSKDTICSPKISQDFL